MLNSVKSLVALVGSIVVATSAVAVEESKSEGRALKVANADVSMTGAFKTEWSHTNNGLGKVNDGGKEKKSAGFGVDYAKLGIGGKLNSDVEFKFGLNLLSSKWSYGNPADLVENAQGTWWASKMFGLTLGKSRVNQDGYSGKEAGDFNGIWGKAPYVGPFKSYAPMLSVHLNPGDFGKFTLQLLDDVTQTSGGDSTRFAAGQPAINTTNRDGTWNGSNKQPAAILQYTGKFGPIAPLFQLGQYDMNHSRFIDVGAKFAMADLGVTFDYLLDNYSQKVPKKSGDGFEGKNITHTNISLRADYTVKGIAKPFLWVNSFNRSGEKDVTGGTEDVKGNVNPAASTDCIALKACFDDNAMSMSVGSYILAMGDDWTPYIAYRTVSGKFNKSLTGGTETASGTNSTIAIGAAGSF